MRKLPCPAQEAPARRRTRDFIVKFGCMRLAPKFAEDGFNIKAWQITCCHPKHKDEGCNKTHSVSMAADEDECIRRLKLWGIWGLDVDTKADHKAMWDQVLAESEAGRLPTMAMLDDMVPERYPEPED